MSKWLRVSVFEKIDEYNNYRAYERNNNHNQIIIISSWIIIYMINFFIASYKMLTIKKLSHSTYSARSSKIYLYKRQTKKRNSLICSFFHCFFEKKFWAFFFRLRFRPRFVFNFWKTFEFEQEFRNENVRERCRVIDIKYHEY